MVPVYEVNYLSVILCNAPKSTADTKTYFILLAKAPMNLEFSTRVSIPSKIETITNRMGNTKRRNCGGAPLSLLCMEGKQAKMLGACQQRHWKQGSKPECNVIENANKFPLPPPSANRGCKPKYCDVCENFWSLSFLTFWPWQGLDWCLTVRCRDEWMTQTVVIWFLFGRQTMGERHWAIVTRNTVCKKCTSRRTSNNQAAVRTAWCLLDLSCVLH